MLVTVVALGHHNVRLSAQIQNAPGVYICTTPRLILTILEYRNIVVVKQHHSQLVCAVWESNNLDEHQGS